MLTNVTNTSTTDQSEPFVLLDVTSRGSLVPPQFLWTFVLVIVLGGVLNNTVLAVCPARRRTLPAALHLCLVDTASLVLLAPYEIFLTSDPEGVWRFPTVCCPIFLGLEVLLGTATVYLIIVINFSSAAGGDRSIAVPLVTVWLLAVSLSVPDFIFGEVVSPRPDLNICCLPKRAAFLISAFRLVLPVFLLFVGTLIVIFVLFRVDNPRSLYLALALSLTYIAVSVQRSVFGALYWYLSGPGVFRSPPLADVAHNPVGTLSLALVHYSLSAVRPAITWLASPDLRVGSDQQPNTNQVV